MLLLVLAFFFAPQPAAAHQLDLAYLDFEVSTSTSALTLTAALHSHQAFELVSTSPNYSLAPLQKNGEAVTAYVQDHVTVERGGAACEWNPGSAVTPQTEFQALVDGITVAGPIVCPGTGSITVGSSLFLEKFPTQKVVVRLGMPDGYADQLVLDRTTRIGELDVSPLFPSATSTEEDPVAPAASSLSYAVFASILIIATTLLSRRAHRIDDKKEH